MYLVSKQIDGQVAFVVYCAERDNLLLRAPGWTSLLLASVWLHLGAYCLKATATFRREAEVCMATGYDVSCGEQAEEHTVNTCMLLDPARIDWPSSDSSMLVSFSHQSTSTRYFVALGNVSYDPLLAERHGCRGRTWNSRL